MDEARSSARMDIAALPRTSARGCLPSDTPNPDREMILLRTTINRTEPVGISWLGLENTTV